ncbi:helix-turn-helix transcriptional regulator [Polaribacter litorisediminis]|uniref:helix-turn-helix transcriptional regulator n=1 Tax=Polaribacter litorisediminis TaxID=1908341 RepID=UPI001CBF5017|nr:helix-turn-helix transcriptional regulator [Polaribacter litorisediminis]UAM97956.1 helix-turn-helix transcriptional regulator [Polaribacter litorisediminis]
MKNKIKEERAICKLTQAELARKVGVSRQSIHLIEKNKTIPSTVLALKISRIFQKPVNVFFELDEKE